MEPITLLPEKYYLENFLYLLSFVEEHYGKLLTEEELSFIYDFKKLGEPEQCLYVRLACRKPLLFRLSKLNYPEISGIEHAADELCNKGFLHIFMEGEEPHMAFLECFSKDEVAAAFNKAFPENKIPKSAKKEVYTDLLETVNPLPFFNKLLQGEPILMPLKKEFLELYGFLFFGNFYFDMSRFVVRDLGRVKYEEATEGAYKAMFKEREELVNCYAMYRQYHAFVEMADILDTGSLHDWFFGEVATIKRNHPKTLRAFDKLALKLGKFLEKEKLLQEALHVYSLTNEYPARERMVRIMEKCKDPENAICLAKVILQSPVNPEEFIFAQDFLSKKENITKKRSSTIKLNEEGEVIQISQWHANVEETAIAYFKERGYQAFFSENYPFKALFGLLFWEVIFRPGELTSPFQVAPEGTMERRFYQENKNQFEKLLKDYESQDNFKKAIQENYQLKYGIANPFVYWHEDLLQQVMIITEKVSHKPLLKALKEIIKNPKENTTGFPDLFVYNEKEYFFAEVKSVNDHLSNKQLFWINHFQTWKVPVRIIRPL
jgi:hypothetical protein